MLEECAVCTRTIINSQIPFNADYLSLVCAILNKNLKPLNTSKLNDELVPCIICHLSKKHNHLKERIDQEDLDKKNARHYFAFALRLIFFCKTFPKLQVYVN